MKAWVWARRPGAVGWIGTALAALLLAGCSGPFGIGGAGAPSLPPEQILQRSETALATVSSFHFQLQTNAGGGTPSGSFSLVSAQGDVARPDKLSATMDAVVGGFTVSLKYLSAGGKHFLTDPLTQQWTEVPPQFNTVALFSPDQGAAGILRGMSQLKAASNQRVDGVDCYHLAGTAGGDVLKPILGVAAPAPLRAEVWVGSNDFLARQIVVAGAILPGDSAGTVRTLKLGNFNETVDIRPPASAGMQNEQ